MRARRKKLEGRALTASSGCDGGQEVGFGEGAPQEIPVTPPREVPIVPLKGVQEQFGPCELWPSKSGSTGRVGQNDLS